MINRIPILSVTRPWSTWIAHGIKAIENRTWRHPTYRRGPLWIHAAQSFDDDALDFAEDIAGDLTDEQIQLIGSTGPYSMGYPTGILALVELTDVCGAGPLDQPCTCGPWAAERQYHWRLTNPRRLATPIAARGKLGLWWPTGDLAEQLNGAARKIRESLARRYGRDEEVARG